MEPAVYSRYEANRGTVPAGIQNVAFQVVQIPVFYGRPAATLAVPAILFFLHAVVSIDRSVCLSVFLSFSA